MRKRTATSYDVARLAGVSQSAVSRAFSAGASIAAETRQKVLAAARELGYQPNAIARSMSSARHADVQRTGIIGLIVTRLPDPFFSQIIDMFSRSFQLQGWHLLLFSVEAEAEVDRALTELMRFKIDGAIVMSALMSDHMAGVCRRAGIPVVLYNRRASRSEASSVCIDNADGGAQAAGLLLQTGHGRIAFLGGSHHDATSDDREAGFLAGLERGGLRLAAREEGDFTFDSGVEAGKRLLLSRERPDAVFCASDVMALGVLHAAQEYFGLSVPRELSILGFDDIPAAAWPRHQLTTIRQPYRAMVREAVEILIRQLEAPDGPGRDAVFAGQLILRRTVRGANLLPDGGDRAREARAAAAGQPASHA
ncbi:MAG: LacI family DNA-binding transcriptional regulator [Rhodobacteraceae bacterium]|jgi:DNA-binding LacI/PurR family transcriptional regulator|nr:LacI family DNA-binding transcriptional regulator [Paracoccaceae bacterium]